MQAWLLPGGEPALGRMFPPFARLKPLRAYQPEADKPSRLLVTRHTAQAFRADYMSEGLAGYRHRDTRAPGQPVKQGGPCREDTWALGLDDRGWGEASFRAVHGQAGTLGPLLQPPRPPARAPSGLRASPPTPVCPVGAHSSAVAWSLAWRVSHQPGAGREGMGASVLGSPATRPADLCPESPTPSAVSPRGTRVHTQARVHTCPDSHAPLPREVSSPRAAARAVLDGPPAANLGKWPRMQSPPDRAAPHGRGFGPVGGVCLGGLPNVWQKPLRDASPALPRFLEGGEEGRRKRKCLPPLSLGPVWGSSACIWRTSQKARSACLDGLPLHSSCRPRPAELSRRHFPRSGPHGQGLASAVDACVLSREMRVTDACSGGSAAPSC